MRRIKRIGNESGLWAQLEAPMFLGRPHLDLGTVCLRLNSRSVTRAKCRAKS